MMLKNPLCNYDGELKELQPGDKVGEIEINLPLNSVASLDSINSVWALLGPHQNFLLQTESFDSSTWVKTNLSASVTANSATDPRGSATAENIPAGTDATGSIKQTITNSSTGFWTFSVWLKTLSGTGTAILRIDTSAETGTEKIVQLTTTWRRLSITQEFTTAHTTKTVNIINGTDAIVAWGAQLEPVDFPRSYSGPRTTSALTALTTAARLLTSIIINGSLSGVTSLSVASSSGVITLSRTSVAVTSADGIVIDNSTAATAAVPIQMSARIRLSGRVWDTASISSKSVNFKTEVVPVSGDAPSGKLVFSFDLNGAGYSDVMKLLSDGTLQLGINGTRAGKLALQGLTSGEATIKVKDEAGTTTFVLPIGNGTAGQVLSTNGEGETSWITIDAAIVGLGNVTNDAQLKRTAGDINTFTEKTTPVDNDILLIEDSADSYNKKKVKKSSLGGGKKTIIIYKPANETIINSAVYQDDDHLSTSIEANGIYQYELLLMINHQGSASAGLKVRFSAPAGATAHSYVFRNTNSNNTIVLANQVNTLILSAETGVITASGNYNILKAEGVIINSTVAGSLILQWAQNAAIAISSIVMAGSYLKLIKIN